MAEAIENVIDGWLETQLIAHMGSGSSYSTLKLLEIDTAVLRTYPDWKDREFPCVGYTNTIAKRTADQHIGGVIHVTKPIVYALTFVSSGTEVTAIQSARTLLARFEVMLNTLGTTPGSLTSLVTDYNTRCNAISWFSGSRTQREGVEAGASQLRRFKDPQNTSRFFGRQDISIVFHTITGVS